MLSFDDMTLLYRRFLQTIGILPFDGRDFSFIGTRILFAYHFFSSHVHWTMFLFYAINSKGIPTIDTLCETVMVIGLNVRYYLLIPHRKEFQNLLEECRQFWEAFDEKGRRLVHGFEQKIRKLFLFLLISSLVENAMYVVSAISLTLAGTHANGTDPRVFPFKWYTENENTVNWWPGYKITFAIQTLVVYNADIILSIVDSAAPFLIILCAGFFRALQDRLCRISEYENNLQLADFELFTCLRLHQRLLNFCLRVDKITRTLFLVQLLCTGYNTSLIAIKIAGSDPDKYKYVPLGLINMGQLMICQWASDYIIDESRAVSTSAYYVSFTWMRRRIGKFLVLIIARAQRPVQMTAGGIVNLSLENFGSMLTSAVSFFAVLRNFNV